MGVGRQPWACSCRVGHLVPAQRLRSPVPDDRPAHPQVPLRNDMTTFEFTPRLAEDVKAEWIAALESGDYEQGQGALALVTDEGKRTYCCLGVLCEVLASSERVSLPVSIDEQESRYVQYDESSTSLPDSVQRYASLPGYPTVCIPDEPWMFVRASATVAFHR